MFELNYSQTKVVSGGWVDTAIITMGIALPIGEGLMLGAVNYDIKPSVGLCALSGGAIWALAGISLDKVGGTIVGFILGMSVGGGLGLGSFELGRYLENLYTKK